MKGSPDIEAAAVWLEAEAARIKSGAGIAVPEADTGFAAQRLRACADGLRAGLHLADPVIEAVTHG